MKLPAAEADFGLNPFQEFGGDRFTLNQYFRQCCGSRQAFPFRDEAEHLTKQLNSAMALEACPGPRGGPGWRVRPEAVPALKARAAVKQRKLEAERAKAQEWNRQYQAINDRPAELRAALVKKLAALGLTSADVESVLQDVGAIVSACARAGIAWRHTT